MPVEQAQLPLSSEQRYHGLQLVRQGRLRRDGLEACVGSRRRSGHEGSLDGGVNPLQRQGSERPRHEAGDGAGEMEDPRAGKDLSAGGK